MVLPNRKHISSAIWKFMTCFPAKLVTFPVCPGYWHDFGARHNLPSKCLCLGQMVTCVSCVANIPRIPTLAMISSAPVTSPHFDKWQLNKWAEMSALHSDRKTWLSLSLEDPQGVWGISWSEQLLCLADILWRIKGLFTRPRAGHRPGSVHSGILRLHEPGLGQSWLTRVSFFFARLKGLVTTCQWGKWRTNHAIINSC